jgi:hypothetical protein
VDDVLLLAYKRNDILIPKSGYWGGLPQYINGIPTNIFPSTCKVILSYIISKLGQDKDNCWPSQKTIALEAGMHKDTVNGSLKFIEACGFIKIKKFKNKTDQWSNKYYVNIPVFNPNCYWVVSIINNADLGRGHKNLKYKVSLLFILHWVNSNLKRSKYKNYIRIIHLINSFISSALVEILDLVKVDDFFDEDDRLIIDSFFKLHFQDHFPRVKFDGVNVAGKINKIC